MVAYLSPKERKQRKKSGRLLKLWEWRVFRVGLCVMCLMGSVLYIIEMTKMSTTGFEITELQRQVEALEKENQRLDVDIASYRSLARVQERLKEKNFVVAEQVVYIRGTQSVVARR